MDLKQNKENLQQEKFEEDRENDSYLPKPMIMCIASYLNNKEVCNLLEANSYFMNCIQAYFKMILQTLIAFNQYLSSQQEDDKTNWAYLYAQIITKQSLYIHSGQIKCNPHDQSNIYESIGAQQFVNKKRKQLIDRIYQGGKISACYSDNKKRLAITTGSELDKIFDQENQENTDIIELEGISQVSIGASDAAYININGELFIVFHSSVENKIVATKQVKLEERVKLVSVSIAYTFTITESNKVYAIKQTENLIPQEVKGMENKIIVDIKSGNTQTLLLTEDQLVFKIEHSQENDQELKAVQINKLLNVTKIAACYNHYLALTRKDTLPIQNWSHKEVEEWFNKIGFEMIANLIKFHQINGEQILNADETYLEDTLGIYLDAEKEKFSYELSRVKSLTFGQDILYGWGSNNFGQLGLLGSFFQEPKMVPLPEFSQGEFVTQLETSFKHTAVLTNKGQLWLTGNYKPEKIKEKEGNNEEGKLTTKKGKKGKHDQNEEEKDEISEQYKKQQEKLKKKKQQSDKLAQKKKEQREENKTQNDKELNLKHRWISLTHIFLQDKQNVKITEISICNKIIQANICYSTNNQSKLVNKHKSGMKFQGGNIVVKKLAYLAKENPQKKYTVCYEDRFLGLVETDVVKFYYHSDIPLHRIQIFKVDGEVIWDRKKRFSAI